MKVNEFDVVELTDGRSGTVLDIYDTPMLGYGVDLDYGEEMPSADQDDYVIVGPEGIKRVLYDYEAKQAVGDLGKGT